MLYKHQEVALARFKDARAIPLFFEVGTGKTATALLIAYHQFLTLQIDRVLVIAPNGVHIQWATQEIPKWLPNDKFTLSYKRNNRWTPPPSDPSRLQISCVNVDVFSTERAYKPIVQWTLSGPSMIILDEAQSIKNIKARRTQVILNSFNEVKRRGRAIISSTPLTHSRIVLSGTPVTNSPVDLWSIFEFLQPNYFDMSYYEFKSNFVIEVNLPTSVRPTRIPLSERAWHSIKSLTSRDALSIWGISLNDWQIVQKQTSFQGPYKNLDHLKSLVYKTAMTVHLKDVVDMPEKVYITRTLEMSPTQKRLCKEIQTDLYTQYGFVTPEGTTTLGELDVPSILVARLRLAQIASGFISLDPSEDPDERQIQWIEGADIKLRAVQEEVSSIEGPVIIITRFTAEALRLHEIFPQAALITGTHKVGSVEEWQEGKYDIMIANIHCIARGFNMQRAHYMLFYSNSDSLEDRIQVEGRIHRAGQEHPCFYIDYQMKSGVDSSILERLSLKKELFNYFLSTGAGQSIDAVV